MGKDYQLEPMTSEGLARIYPTMKKDFGFGELKPESNLRKQMEAGIEDGWFLQADGQEAGYALVITHESIPIALLDYIATYQRGQGDGSAFLALLQQKYPQGLIAEVEAEVPGDSEDENELRRRRMGFYQRAGFHPYPFEAKVFGVHYVVHMWIPGNTLLDTAEAAEEYAAFYRLQVPKAIANRFVHIKLP